MHLILAVQIATVQGWTQIWKLDWDLIQMQIHLLQLGPVITDLAHSLYQTYKCQV